VSKILEEVHEGVYNSHIEGLALRTAAMHTGYYWLSLKEASTNLVRKCNKCQKVSLV